MRVLVTRSEGDARRLGDDLRGRGHDVIQAPLLEIRFLECRPPAFDGVQAILATSANGPRALSRRMPDGPPDLPLFAVGDATARTAREIGFDRVESAGGDVEALAALVEARLTPADGPLLHVAAAEVAGDLAGRLGATGFEVRREVLYEALPAETLSDEAVRALAGGQIDAALFFSPRAATAFARLASEADVDAACREVIACCLSPAVAREAAALPWRDVVVASAPSEAALLASLEEMVVAKPPKTGTGDDAENETADPAPDDAAATAGLSDTPFTATDASPELNGIDDPVASGPGPIPPARPRHRAWRIAWVASLVVAFVVGMLVWPATSPYLLPYLPDFLQDPKVLRLAALEARLESLGVRVATPTPSDPAPARLLVKRIDALEKRLKSAGPAADPALAAKLDMLAKRIGEVEARPASPAGDGDDVARRLTALDEAVTALQGRALASSGGSDEAAEAARALTGRIDAVAGEAKALGGRLDEVAGGLAGRIIALDRKLEALAAASGTPGDDTRRQALVLAVGHLDNAVRSGRAYAEALATVGPLAEGDGRIEAALATLKVAAARGLATPAALRVRFQPLIAPSLAADGRPSGEKWWDYMWHQIFGLVTVRRHGDIGGEGTEAALARAEARLERGDVAGALEAVKPVKGGAADTLTAWRGEAEAWVAATTALDGLRARAIQLLGAG